MIQAANNSLEDAANWRTAVDERSGRTYWYHKFTRESTWVEPDCLKVSRMSVKQVVVQPQQKPHTALSKVLDGVAQPNEIVSQLYSRSEHSQLEALGLIANTLNKATICDWVMSAELLPAICSVCVTSGTSTIRQSAAKLLWVLAMFPESSSLFANCADWKHLVEYFGRWDTESEYLVCATIAILSVGTVQTLIQSSVYSIALNRIAASCESDCGVNQEHFFGANQSQDGPKLLSIESLALYSVHAINGSPICGYLLVWSACLAIRSEKFAIEFIRNGGIAFVQRLCISQQVSPTIASKAKTILTTAMASSSTIRSRCLENWLDLAGSLELAATRSKVVNGDASLPQRDVLLRARASVEGWRVNSTMLWIRCLGLRRVLEEFWNDRSAAVTSATRGFELELDANFEVLSCVVEFLHSSLFVPPASLQGRLDVLKLVSDLEMTSLRKLALDGIHQLLDAASVESALSFGRMHRLHDLIRVTEDFCVTGKLPACRYGLATGDSSSTANLNLREAIAASLSDVTAILNTSSLVPTAAPSRQNQMSTNSSNQGDSNERLYGFKDDDRPPERITSAKSSIPPKSGGIYKLLLQDHDAGGDSQATESLVARGTTSAGIRTDDKKMPGRVMGNNTVKSSSSHKAATAGSARSTAPQTGKLTSVGPNSRKASLRDSHVGVDDSADPDQETHMVQYTRHMSLVPQKEMTANEKRLAEMSRPRNPIQKKSGNLTRYAEDDGGDLIDEETDDNNRESVSTTGGAEVGSRQQSVGSRNGGTQELHRPPLRASSPPIQPSKRQSQPAKPSADLPTSFDAPVAENAPIVLDPVARGSLQLLKTRVRRGTRVKMSADVDEDIDTGVSSSTDIIPSLAAGPPVGPLSTRGAPRNAGSHTASDPPVASITSQPPDDTIYGQLSEFNDIPAEAEIELIECPNCHRGFAEEPFQRHVPICAKVSQRKRRTFDSKSMRTAAISELNDVDVRSIPPATARGKAGATTPAKPIGSWAEKSNAFREAMRAAREVSKALSKGEPLPPPVISAPDPSLIPCPHCNRRFNDRAAERHIPQCQSIRAKPNALKKGSGGMAAQSAGARKGSVSR